MRTLTALWQGFNRFCEKTPQALVLLLGRIAIASVFWRSAQSKISGWEYLDQSWQFFNVSQSALQLFRYEYALPLLSPTVAAYVATAAEFFLPLLLVLGLGTRFAAFGLIVMTGVIQFLVYPDAWPVHILWFAILFYLLRNGAGELSLDRLLSKQ